MDLFTNKYDENVENLQKLNLDDLYERKKQADLSQLYIFNKVLNRIHEKIKITSRQRNNYQCCWYVVPEVMIGVPNYDHNGCITYLIDKLQENDFIVKYTHPNLLFISWKHYVPNYVRNEIKKKTGTIIDAFGNYVESENKEEENKNIDPTSAEALVFNKKIGVTKGGEKKEYKSINSYKPTGNLVYNNDLFKKIEEKL